MPVSLSDIESAKKLLTGIIKYTDLDHCPAASDILGSQVYLKFENTQFTGSFKIRGAYNKIMSLTQDEKNRGVVASSAGNHAQGVALSAQRAGVKSTIVMPVQAPLIKVDATKSYGADVILHGEVYDEAYERARELEKSKGFVFVHPYEDPLVIAGQGTIGFEILDKIVDLDSVIIPIGGGGLISGIATVIKTLKPSCKVFGVQSNQTPGMSELFHHQTVSERRRVATIADGIAIKKPSQKMYENYISRLVDEIVTVSDEEIAEAIVFLLEKAKTVTEGSGAAGMAALFNRKLDLGKKTCVVLCGGNIDLNIVAKIIEKGLTRKGRLIELSVVVDDLPGSLHKLTGVLADERANILEVRHDRISSNLFLRETRIDITLEVSGLEHIQKIKNALENTGAKIL
jgi:threonine dehydratase